MSHVFDPSHYNNEQELVLNYDSNGCDFPALKKCFLFEQKFKIRNLSLSLCGVTNLSYKVIAIIRLTDSVLVAPVDHNLYFSDVKQHYYKMARALAEIC